jgi:hypothetical protein
MSIREESEDSLYRLEKSAQGEWLIGNQAYTLVCVEGVRLPSNLFQSVLLRGVEEGKKYFDRTHIFPEALDVIKTGSTICVQFYNEMPTRELSFRN